MEPPIRRAQPRRVPDLAPRAPMIRAHFDGPELVETDHPAVRRCRPVERTDAFFLAAKSGSGLSFQVFVRWNEKPWSRRMRPSVVACSSLTTPQRTRWAANFRRGPHGERQAQVVRPRAHDLQDDADLFRRILRRPAGRLPWSQRREAAGIEPPNQRSHILFVEIQPPGNGSRPHPLPREGDDLCAPQIRRRLRRLQDPSQPPDPPRASVLETYRHTGTSFGSHVCPYWIRRALKVQDAFRYEALVAVSRDAPVAECRGISESRH